MKTSKEAVKNDVQKVSSDEEDMDIDFSVDKEDEWMIFESFTNYSDPHGSIVREIASNAWDAHIEADVDRDIKIEITDKNELTGAARSISFRDYGTGMSPDLIKNIYSKFGKSTKRHTNDLIGAKGFGAKAPLGYTNMFTLVTIHDGTKYTYTIHKGESKPTITPMGQEPTDEPSGSEVIINIKEGDKAIFKSALRNQLKYFDNIKYVNCGISNDYRIIRGKHFIYRVVKDHSKYDDKNDLHICLGKVKYPIDNKFVSSPNLDVGLQFEIGDLPVVWNRESIEYKKGVADLIKDKKEKARKELQQLYNKKFEAISSIEDLFSFEDDNQLISLYEDDQGNSQGIYVNGYFINTSRTHPDYEYLQVRAKARLFRTCFRVGRTLNVNYASGFYSYKPFQDKTLMMQRGENFSSYTDEYLQKHTTERTFILRPRRKKNAVRSIIKKLFSEELVYHPYNYDKEKRQQVIEEAYKLYNQLTDELLQKGGYYKHVNVPDSFIEKIKEERRKERERKKELFHYMRARKNGSFSRYRINGNRLIPKFGDDTVIYGFQKHRAALRKIKGILKSQLSYNANENIHVIQISMKNERVVKEVLPDTAHHVNDVENIRYFRKLSNSYNKDAFKRDLKLKYDNLDFLSYRSIPSYIDPEEPTQEEKNEIYRKIGQYFKYPLMRYVNTTRAPDHHIEEYKQKCEYHDINPILIGKKVLNDYEEDQRTEE